MKRRAYVLLHLCVTCVLTSAAGLTQTSNACYSSGGDCGFHTLSCQNGLSISVVSMHYGFKSQAAYDMNSCQNLLTDCSAFVRLTTCCSYDVSTDCLRPYSMAQKSQVESLCNGQKGCTFHGTYVSGGCNNPPNQYHAVSSYSVVKYVCSNSSNKQDSLSVLQQSAGGRPMSTTVKIIPGERTKVSNETEKQQNKRMLQLIVGVSVGVGSGFICLVIIVIVCWIRVRRKSSQDSVRTGETRVGSASHSPSTAMTVNSTMPSSYYSSFYYSDTLPSSHPDSIYPETIYNLPADDYTTQSAGHSSHFTNYGYDNTGDSSARDVQGESGTFPRYAEPSDSVLNGHMGRFGATPRLPERPKTVRPRIFEPHEQNMEMDGPFMPPNERALPSLPPSVHAHPGFPEIEGTPLFSQPAPTHPATLSAGKDRALSNASMSRNHSGSDSPVNNNQHILGQPRNSIHDSVNTQNHNNIVTPHQELRHPSANRQSFVTNNLATDMPHIYSVPDKKQPQGVHSTEQRLQPHQAVQSWLDNVKNQVHL